MGNTIGMLAFTIIGRDLSHARVCVCLSEFLHSGPAVLSGEVISPRMLA